MNLAIAPCAVCRPFGLLLVLAMTGILGCAGSAPRPVETGGADADDGAVDSDQDAPPPGGVLNYRFRMIAPANDDFTFNDEDVHIYIKPFVDYVSVKIRSRRENFIRIYWEDSEFVDILGRRYKLVPDTVSLQDATRGVPPTDIQEGILYSGRLHLLDTANLAAVQQLGGKPWPIVPPDAGSPDQVRRQLFDLSLALELNDARREYNFTFEIREAYYR